jgi:hypothetical protein
MRAEVQPPAISNVSQSSIPSLLELPSLPELNVENTENKDQADMFAAKSRITEALFAASPGSVQMAGLENTRPWNVRLLEPYVRVEEYGDLKNTSIRINEREIISPDVISLEKLISPVDGKEYLLSATVFWNDLESGWTMTKDWLPEDPSADKYGEVNPDGSVSLFVFLDDDTEDIFERRTDKLGELSGVSMNFRGANGYKVREIIEEIAELCSLREPLQTGRWFWRRPNGIPDSDMKRLKNFVDGGLVRWHELSEWNGFPLIDGSGVTWNGVLLSLQLTAGKENSEHILKILEPLSQNSEFSFNTVEEGRILKITVTDNFVLNFASLWGF